MGEIAAQNRGQNHDICELFDGHFSAVDILLTSCLDWALGYDMALPAPLGDYRDRVTARPGYKAMMTENDPSKAKAADK